MTHGAFGLTSCMSRAYQRGARWQDLFCVAGIYLVHKPRTHFSHLLCNGYGLHWHAAQSSLCRCFCCCCWCCCWLPQRGTTDDLRKRLPDLGLATLCLKPLSVTATEAHAYIEQTQYSPQQRCLAEQSHSCESWSLFLVAPALSPPLPAQVRQVPLVQTGS